jgi:hypothetical protein
MRVLFAEHYRFVRRFRAVVTVRAIAGAVSS